MRRNAIFYLLIPVLMCVHCSPEQHIDSLLVSDEDFNIEYQAKQIALFTLRNSQGMVVQLTNYGAKIVTVIVPDRKGNFADVCLGYETAREYLDGVPSMGATIGRFANRIGGGQFSLDDTEYNLPKNAGENTIHGGPNGFRVKVWEAKQLDERTVEMAIFSPDGEDGFPGNFQLKVLFTLTEDNELKLDYHASTDKPTVCNLTNHWFTNLAGHDAGTILDHHLLVNALYYTPADASSIPTGQIAPVEGTPLDFRQMTRIGDHINDDFEQLKFTNGYDQNFVISKTGNEFALAAILYDPESGRVMEVKTTEPGIQVYTANVLSGKDNEVGKGSFRYRAQSSICLETQHFPDSPNKPDFPSTLLLPGHDYVSTTIYRFGVKSEVDGD